MCRRPVSSLGFRRKVNFLIPVWSRVSPLRTREVAVLLPPNVACRCAQYCHKTAAGLTLSLLASACIAACLRSQDCMESCVPLACRRLRRQEACTCTKAVCMCMQATCCSEDPEELECGHYGSRAAAGVSGRAATHVAADWHGHEADHILQVGPCYLPKLL